MRVLSIVHPRQRRRRRLRRRSRRRAGRVEAARERPAPELGRVRRGDGVRRGDARRPGGEASVAARREGAAARGARARHAAARRVPGRSAARRGSRLASASRAAPEIGWYQVEVTDAGRDDPLHWVRSPRSSRSSNGTPTSRRCHPAPWRSRATRPACRPSGWPTGPAWAVQFHAEVTGADAESGSTNSTSDPRRVATGLDPDVIRAESEAADRGTERAGAASWPALHGGGAGHRGAD